MAAKGAPPTRILSWAQMVQQADPDFRQLSLRPWVYAFSNGRLFVDPLPLYGSFGIVSDTGAPISDDFGTQIQADSGGTNTGTSTGFPFGQGAFGVDPF